MSITTVSSKGQITLPAEARRSIGIKASDRVVVDVRADHIVVRPVKDFFELDGFLGKAHSLANEKTKMRKAVASYVEGVK